MSLTPPRPARKGVIAFLGVTTALVLVAAWFTDGLLHNEFVTYPRSPRVQNGLTVPYAVKGITVFISVAQDRLLHWLAVVEICSGVAIAILILVYGDPYAAPGSIWGHGWLGRLFRKRG